MLEELAAELPQEFYNKLNGGIILLPQHKMHPKNRANDLYIMGEYHRDASLGRYIAVYYGSFIRVYGHTSPEQIKQRLRSVLRHEFRHHLESMAGERGLEAEDEQNIERYLRRYGREP